MSTTDPTSVGGAGALTPTGAATAATTQAAGGNLGDLLERVLDKGVVIAGDIQINLLDIELLTIKLRLLIASVDTARRMGIKWWETDPALAGADQGEDSRSLRERVRSLERQLESGSESDRSLTEGDVEEENRALREEVKRLESRLERASKSGKGGDG
jgi:Gas vesicle protein